MMRVSQESKLKQISQDIHLQLTNKRNSINSQPKHEFPSSNESEERDNVAVLQLNPKKLRQTSFSPPSSSNPRSSESYQISNSHPYKRSNTSNQDQRQRSSGPGSQNQNALAVSKGNGSWNFGRLFRAKSDNRGGTYIRNTSNLQQQRQHSMDKVKTSMDDNRYSVAQSLQRGSVMPNQRGGIETRQKRQSNQEDYNDGAHRYLERLELRDLMKNYQFLVFALSYVANFLVLFGSDIEFVIAVYYNQRDPSEGEVAPGLDYQDLQVTLLLSSLLFFFLGNILEYIKKSNALISSMILLIGVFKLIGGLLDFTLKRDGYAKYTFQQSQFIHVLVALRLAIQTVFITGMFKWFSRPYLPILIGAWFTNEYLAVKLSWVLAEHASINMMVAGSLLIVLSVCFYKYYVFDPIDCGLIINEQAIALTSKNSSNGEVQDLIRVDDFVQQHIQSTQSNSKQMVAKKEVATKNSPQQEFGGAKNRLLGGDEPKRQEEIEEPLLTHVDDDERDSILRRWKTPSFMKIFEYDGVINMIIGSCLIFFKFRVVSKSIVSGHYKDRFNQIIGCFIASSEFMQIVIGYLILKYLRGRRLTISFIFLFALLLVEVIQLLMSLIGVTEEYTLTTLVIIQGQLVFTLYYIVCILGPIEMAKITLLRNNIKIGGYLLCLMGGFQYLAQAAFFDNLIFILIPKTDDSTVPNVAYILKAVDILSTVLAMITMIKMLKQEIRELKAIRGHQMSSGQRPSDYGKTSSQHMSHLLYEVRVKHKTETNGKVEEESNLSANITLEESFQSRDFSE